MLSEPQAAELLSSLSTLLRTSRAISMKSHGASVTGTQIAALKVLSAGEVRMGDLAEKLMVAPSVASRVVATLEQEGLVQRHPDPADARACLLELSDLGRERLRERQRFSLALMRDVLADWTDDEAATAARFMSDWTAASPTSAPGCWISPNCPTAPSPSWPRISIAPFPPPTTPASKTPASKTPASTTTPKTTS